MLSEETRDISKFQLVNLLQMIDDGSESWQGKQEVFLASTALENGKIICSTAYKCLRDWKSIKYKHINKFSQGVIHGLH